MHSEKERNKPPYNSLKKYLGVNLTKVKGLLLSPGPKLPTVRSCPRTAPKGRDPAGGARAAASQPGESGGRRCLGCAPHPTPRGSNAAVVAKCAVAGGAARAAARELGLTCDSWSSAQPAGSQDEERGKCLDREATLSWLCQTLSLGLRTLG